MKLLYPEEQELIVKYMAAPAGTMTRVELANFLQLVGVDKERLRHFVRRLSNENLAKIDAANIGELIQPC